MAWWQVVIVAFWVWFLPHLIEFWRDGDDDDVDEDDDDEQALNRQPNPRHAATAARVVSEPIPEDPRPTHTITPPRRPPRSQDVFVIRY
ncbi:hypothetical protein L596_000370 [Steinernema carpocapsae]|uniref:Secreted protein n=1 Tax=Steinernema carpocapsae TaxID=34508 RepID=A0A4U8UKC7_STECR|nr:hypothetical protein L596_000370 [Steinernema carpocapsae]